MNKIYKVIWNATLGTWVAVSELAKGKTKSSKVTSIVGAVSIGLMVTFSPGAMAAWTNTGGNATAGSYTGAIAIGGGGQPTDANSNFAVAVGNNTHATGLSATAFGSGSNANGVGALSVGNDAQATADNATAVGAGNNDGTGASASGVGSIAVGNMANAKGFSATAIGSRGQAGSAKDIVRTVAPTPQTIGNRSIVVTANTNSGTFSTGSMAFTVDNVNATLTYASNNAGGGITGGTYNGTSLNAAQAQAFYASIKNATLFTGVTAGTTPLVTATQKIGDRNIVVTGGAPSTGGTVGLTVDGRIASFTVDASGNATAGSFDGVALSAAQAGELYSSLLNGNSSAFGSNSIAMGSSSVALMDRSTAVGQSALAMGISSVALGDNATSKGWRSVAIGKQSNAVGNDAIALGFQASTDNKSAANTNATTKAQTNAQSIAIGAQTQAFGDQAVALGANAKASGNSSVSIGGDDLNSVANVGGVKNTSATAQYYKNLTGDDLIGATTYIATESSGDASVAVGVQALASGHLATAFGTRTLASGAASLALGVGSSATKDNAIAIGAGSTTNTDAAVSTDALVNGVTYSGFAAGSKTLAGDQMSVGGGRI